MGPVSDVQFLAQLLTKIVDDQVSITQPERERLDQLAVHGHSFQTPSEAGEAPHVEQ